MALARPEPPIPIIEKVTWLGGNPVVTEVGRIPREKALAFTIYVGKGVSGHTSKPRCLVKYLACAADSKHALVYTAV